MAVGDITYDTGSPTRSGSFWQLTGTLEVDKTLRAFALGSTGIRLVSVQLEGEDGVGSVQVRLNENAAGTSTMGTAAIVGNHASTNTYRFVALFK